ncbi:pentatricopeptide repeat-containing protein At1g11290, chloroplastic-like [Quercus robur]|uniref:pentatricopeptide repeat-containing protein At1g11290, chloroplastic-like n=1 Tax=Quercus robur TaxID=38942 RepID=UPI0021611B23|nr:pentatricopeptide repeat-containing protein At1g11290, chloroplastic-like [Quercus robur]
MPDRDAVSYSIMIVGTAMLDMYAKCGSMINSYKVIEGMKNPGLISCNAVVAGFVRNGLFEEGIVLFNQFRKFGLVLDMYSSLLDLDAAAKIFDEMECKDVINWTTMIGLLIDLECAAYALELFSRMRDSGISHDTVVIMNLISACAIIGDLKRRRKVQAQAVVCGFGSELTLVNSLTAMYSKCGDLNSSITVFDQISQKSLVSWTAMILGYAQNGHPREALNLLVEDLKLD